MRTTIEISDALYSRAKQLARKRGATMRRLVEAGLARVLEDEEAEIEEQFVLQDASFGEGGLVDGLSETDWDAIRSRAYEGRGG